MFETKFIRIIAACINSRRAMNRIFIIFCLPIAALFFSCSTDIDLYADYQEKPVIYGVLDSNADTNFIKITRTFFVQQDAYQVAANPDSSNYPGKLDVRLIEFCNGDSIREIILDTITIHNKEQGVFYAPHQKLYYTTERLGMNTKKDKYSYRLRVVLPNRVLTTQAKMVGSSSFDVQSLGLNFSKEYFGTRRPFLFRPATNAGIYHVTIAFTFLEQRTPDADSVPKTMYWDKGYYLEGDLANSMDEGCYVFKYRPEEFYAHLAEFVGGDTVSGVRRLLTDYPTEVIIEAAGENLRQYIYLNDPANGIAAGDNEFSLIDDGYGVFSSRMIVRHYVRLGGETVPDLLAMTNWGFKFIGGPPR